jgi:HPt (histidine-containing phosphotransfer) domain-containing protein
MASRSEEDVPVSEPDAPVFDEAILGELRTSMGDDDDGFGIELAEAYLADGPTQLAAMEAAIAANDASAVVRPAHTLKSSSATLGALRLAEVCRRFEHTGRAGTIGGEGADPTTLRTEWEAAEAALRNWIASRTR